MVKKFKTFGPQLVFAEQTAGSVVVLTNEQKLSLYKKSQKSGISTDILEEVYRRGYSIWNESFGQTIEQFAFDRVNSFIAGGFAADLDDDLIEAYYSQTRPKQGFEYKGKIIGAITQTSNGYVSRRRKDPDKPTSVQLMQTHKSREDAEKHLISKSGLDENYIEEKRGLWDNIHAKRERIKHGSGEHMRKPGSKGAPTEAALKNSQNEETHIVEVVVQKKMSPQDKQAFNKYLAQHRSKLSALDNNDKAKKSFKDYNNEPGDKPSSLGLRNQISVGYYKEEVKHNKTFKDKETAEKQSHNPNKSESRFDGTKSAKNVYQKATPGQPVTEDSEYGMARNELATAKRAIDRLNAKMGRKGEGELEAWVQSKITKASDYLDTVADYIESGSVKEATEDEAKAAMMDRAKVLDQLVQQNQQAQNPSAKTSVSQTAERRTFTPQGEVKTVADKDGAKVTALVPNQAVRKVAPAPRMTNALTTVKRVVKEANVCEDCNCGLREEVLTERGADSKGYYRSTESGAGLTAKGAKHFGIKTAVTTPPSKLKAGSKAANRRKSFCARMGGMKGPMKDEKGRPTRKAMSLRRWHC